SHRLLPVRPAGNPRRSGHGRSVNGSTRRKRPEHAISSIARHLVSRRACTHHRALSPMKLYLDDDIAQTLLVRLLRRDGHDAHVPADHGMAGQKDAAHMREAIREQAVLLSQNYDDFRLLHELLIE